jgi:hypothetical protein
VYRRLWRLPSADLVVLATSSSARFGGRQPYSIVRNIPYVIV